MKGDETALRKEKIRPTLDRLAENGFRQGEIELSERFTEMMNPGKTLSINDYFAGGRRARELLERIRKEGSVFRFDDAQSGLVFFLGLDTLGNGTVFGGVRLLPANSCDEAVRDALRLSEAMTHKLAMIFEPFGGGKLVVTAPPSGKSEAALLRIGDFTEALDGLLRIAIDFGFEPEDALKIRERTRFIDGYEGPGSLGASGITTALGAMEGMPAVLDEAFGSPKIPGRSFAIQGVGSVGKKLAELLLEDGAKLFISDTLESRLKPFRGIGKVTLAEPDDLLLIDADVLCPSGPACVINPGTIPKLRSRVIAGVANCVLADEVRDDALLLEKKVLFAPDFVLNAGGVTQGVEEVFKGAKDLQSSVDRLPIIPKNMKAVFERAKRRRMGTMAAAKEIAEQRRLKIRAGLSRTP